MMSPASRTTWRGFSYAKPSTQTSLPPMRLALPCVNNAPLTHLPETGTDKIRLVCTALHAFAAGESRIQNPCDLVTAQRTRCLGLATRVPVHVRQRSNRGLRQGHHPL